MPFMCGSVSLVLLDSASQNQHMPRNFPDFETLVDLPSPAVLATYRQDGTASVSPVWFRFHQHHFEVVIARGDPKLAHLKRTPECSLTVNRHYVRSLRRYFVRPQRPIPRSGFDPVDPVAA